MPPAPFQGLIQGNDQALLLGTKGVHQQAEKDVADLSKRPRCPVEHLVGAALVRIALVPRVPQRRRHGSTATAEERPHQEDHDSLPGAFLETTAKGKQPCHENRGQGHATPPEVIFSLKCSWCPVFCIQLALCTKPRDCVSRKLTGGLQRGPLAEEIELARSQKRTPATRLILLEQAITSSPFRERLWRIPCFSLPSWRAGYTVRTL